MRLVPLLLLSFVVAVTPGCSLLDDSGCASDIRIASSTPPLTGAALDQWNQTACTTGQDDLCKQHGMPPAHALQLCSHEPNVMTTDGGAFMALSCHSYSTEQSCRSSSSDGEHHHHH